MTAPRRLANPRALVLAGAATLEAPPGGAVRGA